MDEERLAESLSGGVVIAQCRMVKAELYTSPTTISTDSIQCSCFQRVPGPKQRGYPHPGPQLLGWLLWLARSCPTVGRWQQTSAIGRSAAGGHGSSGGWCRSLLLGQVRWHGVEAEPPRAQGRAETHGCCCIVGDVLKTLDMGCARGRSGNLFKMLVA